MYDYINKIEKYIGRKATRIRSNFSFEGTFYKKYEKGKNVGNIYGFPHTLGGWCNSRLKVEAVRKYQREIGKHTMFLGIAADEPKRLARMKINEISLLDEWGWTEQDCLDYLKEKGLENPLYKNVSRTGCWFCPKQSIKSARNIYKNYPDLWKILLRLDKDSPVRFTPDYSVEDLNNRFIEEDKQITFF